VPARREIDFSLSGTWVAFLTKACGTQQPSNHIPYHMEGIVPTGSQARCHFRRWQLGGHMQGNFFHKRKSSSIWLQFGFPLGQSFHVGGNVNEDFESVCEEMSEVAASLQGSIIHLKSFVG
jgi:hypothetical protein